MPAPIVIMGATSGIGALALKEAETRSIPARAFARSADEITSTELVDPIQGDARSFSDISRAIDGARAVIYAIGIKERPAMLWEKETLFSDTTQLLIKALKEHQIERLVAVTGYGAGRSRQAMSKIEQLGHRAILGRPYADKDRQEQMITQSGLNWTIARPVILTNGPKTGKAKALADPSTWRNGIISRADVASFLIIAVEQDLHIKEDVVLRL